MYRFSAKERRHVVVLDLELNHIDGEFEPSVEKHMHAAAYRTRRDVHAVVHTHPIYSSVFGVVEMPLPAVSEDFAQIDLNAKLLGDPKLFSHGEIEAMQSFMQEHYGKKNREMSASQRP